MQPDIEIYLKDSSHEQVHQWLCGLFQQCSDWQAKGRLYRCMCDDIPVVWYNRAVGSWHSLLFDSAQTPWATDLDCAQAAHLALGVEVRCAPGGWQEVHGEAVADDWLQVNAQGVSQIVWRT